MARKGAIPQLRWGPF